MVRHRAQQEKGDTNGEDGGRDSRCLKTMKSDYENYIYSLHSKM